MKKLSGISTGRLKISKTKMLKKLKDLKVKIVKEKARNVVGTVPSSKVFTPKNRKRVKHKKLEEYGAA